MATFSTFFRPARLSRALAAAGGAARGLWHACCGLTQREREGVMLLAALFVLGLVVQGLRAWLGR